MPSPTVLIANLIAQLAYGLLAMTICLPSMQQWGALLRADATAVQLTFSAFVFAYGAGQLVYGPLSDRHGRRRVLLAGLALAVAGSVAAALAQGITALVLARLLQGAGVAAGAVVARAAVQDSFDGAQKTRVMAFIGMAMGLCPPSASIVGGWVHEHLGWQANFWIISAMGVALMAAAWRTMPADRPVAAATVEGSGSGQAAGTPRQGLRQAYLTVLGDSVFLRHAAVLALTVAAFYAFLAAAPLVLGGYGVGPAGIGWYIMLVPLTYIAGNFMTTRLIARHGEARLMLVGQWLTVAGIVLMLALALVPVRSPLAFSAPLALLGIGHGLLVPSCMARTVGLLPALAGTAMAVAGVAQQFVGALGAWAVGWLPRQQTLEVGALMLGFTLAALVVQLSLPRAPANNARNGH